MKHTLTYQQGDDGPWHIVLDREGSKAAGEESLLLHPQESMPAAVRTLITHGAVNVAVQVVLPDEVSQPPVAT